MTTVDVLADEDGRSLLVGRAHFTRTRGEVSTTFLYDADYLVSGGTSIDPALPLVSGAQHQTGLVRAFSDSAPDRWGRNLVEKAERIRAREEGRAPRRLDDVDFLLGVSDDTRQGALRYRVSGSEAFVGEPSTVPPLLSLPTLLRAADDVSADEDPTRAVKQLLDTGTTGLGGARPKASVRLEDGSLAIAKFPHGSDEWDVMAWESTALDLLDRAGVRTPHRRLSRVGGRSVLILRRFDRTENGLRIGYISAMTALGGFDGDHRDYAELSDSIRDLSFSPRADHHELFDRVVANVALGNTDDHLRNHGFLAERGAWRLSPSFDVNPNPDPWRARSTSIMGADAPPDEAEALIALAEGFSLSAQEGRERMIRIAESLAPWEESARATGIAQREISMMAESIRPRLEAVVTAAR
ncbi:type II toxin-antitoxin system HipA family toxin [Rathayibacter sp. VKM Ac-2856]|uniref:type II toxin-antitoxin system HipA family toxin n=1 Tax=unclassified Rathayibacter TaxID=2609250 RepID=UPI0015678532|nr:MULTISPECIES: type II toxin-antitoxin system HipA family toxin [unclassified Rathayibacter]NQX03751.1 type II toxin-antitoxin system HipA family toxin [Rathayibacter sp. VKM Ac-2858]NQX18919.1 type II toxin-antitoxin system HipA family toxin [Rathayibacter sp. VKM Ac-2856]